MIGGANANTRTSSKNIITAVGLFILFPKSNDYYK